MAVKKKRIRKGNKPDQAKGWEKVLSLPDKGNKNGWDVYVRQNENERYFQIKLVSQLKRRGRGNYWLGWDKHEERFTRNNYTSSVFINVPETEEKIKELMQKMTHSQNCVNS